MGVRLNKDVLPSEGEHGVAREYGGVFVPFAIDGGLPTPQGGAVHEVVVEECEVVERFQPDGWHGGRCGRYRRTCGWRQGA